MAKPQGRPLQFGCPQCTTRLRAHLSQAGTKQRCPQCGHQFVVPTAQQAAVLGRRAEEYAVYQGDYQAQEDATAAGTAAVADCPACGTRVYGPEDQIGHQVACPDCGTKLVLARRPEPRAAKRRPADEDAEAAYAIRQDGEQPAGSPSATDQVDIPVHCPVCDTLLYGTPDQVGKHILCPDCYTPVEVPPPKAPASKATAAHSVEDEYALQADDDPPAGEAAPPEAPPIPVVCSLCRTRMYATRDQVGEMITCPDCGTPMVVPRPDTTPKPGREGTTAGEYRGGEPGRRAESGAPAKARRVGIAPGDTRAADEAASGGTARVRRAGPRWPFVRGILTFPCYRNTWPRFLALIAGLLVVLPVLISSWRLNQIGDVQTLGGARTFLTLALFAVGTILLLVWGIVATALLLAIVQDTAEGNDQIEDWPEPIFSDWAFDFLYIVDSIVVALLPGVVLYQVLSATDLPCGMAVPGSLFFLFPLALLSMLEAGSPFAPVSSLVWGSLFSRWWAWLIFYIETAALLVGSLAIAGVVFQFTGSWGVILIAIAWVWGLMVYFRLLGRVAWCCGPGLRESAGELRDLTGDTGPPADVAPRTPAPPEKNREAPRAAPKPSSVERPVPSPSPAEAEAISPTPTPAEAPSPTQEQPPPRRRARSILDDDFEFS